MSQQIDPAVRAAMLVPDGTRDNYTTAVRRAAVARGITVDAARAQQVKAWREQHDNDPMGSWDVLADWLESADLGAGLDLDPAAVARVRAFESAKRDPGNPQAAILDMSDAEVRDGVDNWQRAAADQAPSMSPVTTQDGGEVPASRVNDVLRDGDDKPSAKAPTAAATVKK